MSRAIPLIDCAGMSNERWLECRAHGPKGDIPYTVGGSDVATIFGLSPWTTPLELWLIKKGRMKTPQKSNPDQLMMGHLLEPIAAYWYAQKTGNTVYDDTCLYQHADHPYALANMDRRFTRAVDGAPGILECKSCTYHKAEDWADGAIPGYYELQLRFYMSFDPVTYGAFSCLWGNNPATDLAIPEIERDTVKEDIIFEKLDRWIWSLEHDKPPKMDEVAKPKLALLRSMVQAKLVCPRSSSRPSLNTRSGESPCFRGKLPNAKQKSILMKRRLKHTACELQRS